MSFNVIKLTEEVRQNYLRYLASTFHLKNPELRELFLKELSKFNLTKGPIIEATPPFKSGCYLRDLVKEGLLSEKIERFIYDAMPYLKRVPLYLHQEKAIRKVLNQRNIVIASGTGSGKTECFLIPILNHLIREYERGELTPGVRALLLYPMNALANDQLNRLRRIARAIEKNIPELKITFGRYIGETRYEREDAIETFKKMFPDEEPVRGELLSREEMQESPPHILLTNYTMLEYMLLRPADSPFFDGKYSKYWKFLVLDEAHIYNGAMGIEIAMLIRRLKDRVCENMEGDIQCIATSATLVNDEKDFPKVAYFATNLFGEKFEWKKEDTRRQDIIKGERIEIKVQKNTFLPKSEFYKKLEEIINNFSDQNKMNYLFKIAKEYVPEEIINEVRKNNSFSAERFLYYLLSRDERVIKLRKLLEEGAKDLKECSVIFNSEGESEVKKLENLTRLVNLLIKARVDNESAPLLPARYHFFIRATEGAFISFYPEKRIYLQRREITKEGYPVFELACCTRCGHEYLVGKIVNNKLVFAYGEDFLSGRRGKKGRVSYFAIIEGKKEIEAEDDEDQYISIDKDIAREGGIWKLCVQCGTISEDEPNCNCERKSGGILVLKEMKPSGDDDELHKCYVCKVVNPKRNIVRQFIFLKDAPASVIATSLYQNLYKNKPRDRKILIFSDSRQDAAFFAPYFEHTYKRILFKHLIYKAISENQNLVDYRLNSLCSDLVKLAEQYEIFSRKMDDKEKLKEAWNWILLEFFNMWDRNTSLEGVGLITFKPIFPKNWQLLKELKSPPWNLTEEEIKNLYWMMLNTMRYNMAVKFPDKAEGPHKNSFFEPKNKEYKFKFSESDRKKGIIGFKPSTRYLNRRLEFLEKLYQSLTGIKFCRKECLEILKKLWDDLTDNWIDNGIYHIYDKRGGILYQLDYAYWRIYSEYTHKNWYICNSCGNIYPFSIKGVCPTYNCYGRLRLISEEERERLERNHYRYLYKNIKPLNLRAKEHTAQLRTDKASEIQGQFSMGKVNVLSCSTTFEMGVDLGELEVIFLKNVPPEPSNYVQRAGRAGRRANVAGLTLTFALLRSHDLTYFNSPEDMVNGRIKPPIVELKNEKIIQRHLNSIVLSYFFKAFPEYYGNLNDFFKFDRPDIDAVQKLKVFLSNKPNLIDKSLKRVIPKDIQEKFDIENWGWISNLIGESGLLTITYKKVKDELDKLRDFYEMRNKEYIQLDNLRLKASCNRDIKWALKRIDTIKKTGLINFLASNVIIPKYGFPVDVVELDIKSHLDKAKDIELERDLRIGISEFAPGSKVVANGYIWESNAIKVVKDKALDEYWYVVCPKCHKFHIEKVTGREHSIKRCQVCDYSFSKHEIDRFIDPRFGFISSRDSEPKRVSEYRPRKEYSTRPYFYNYSSPEEKIFKYNGWKIFCNYSSDGELAVICKGKRGAGFWICLKCGAAFSGKKNSPHKTPYGNECKGKLKPHLHLGHTFKTDVLTILFPKELTREFESNSFWYSLLYALLEGASQAIGINRRDIDGCLFSTSKGKKLVLFDNVPGGAGLVKQLFDEAVFQLMLELAYKRTASCSCGPETSCYSCLRNYQNQFCHHILRRGIVSEFLSRLV